MTFCDNNPNVIQWASEPFMIPYRNPFTGKNNKPKERKPKRLENCSSKQGKKAR